MPYEEYMAIMYEYIEESDTGPDQDDTQGPRQTQEQPDLFWRVSFQLRPPRRAVDWCSGILLDMSGLIRPWHKRLSAQNIEEDPKEDPMLEGPRTRRLPNKANKFAAANNISGIVKGVSWL